MKYTDDHTVSLTADMGLCSSCGICKNICPQGAITYIRKRGMFVPHIDNAACVHCGRCKNVCPGIVKRYSETEISPYDAVYGNIIHIYNAWSKDEKLRFVSASGGIVSSLVQTLLTNGQYDVAFCVDGYDCREQQKTVPVDRNALMTGIAESSLPKSRYLSVSHENAVAYIRDNPDKRVILIGVSCAIAGLRNVIKTLHRDESRYLLIGLFCDKVFSYNVNSYFDARFSDGKAITALHFKNKESGGWPGNMKFCYGDGSERYIDKSERGKIKKYFMPERCLYCIDKLNTAADLSAGDNYTKQDESPLGSNTVIIRTAQGEEAWNMLSDCVEYVPVEKKLLQKAQYLDGRLNNLYFAALKEKEVLKKSGEKAALNAGVRLTDDPDNYVLAWRRNLDNLRIGEAYDAAPDRCQKDIEGDGHSFKRKTVELIRRVYYRLRRSLHVG